MYKSKRIELKGLGPDGASYNFVLYEDDFENGTYDYLVQLLESPTKENIIMAAQTYFNTGKFFSKSSFTTIYHKNGLHKKA